MVFSFGQCRLDSDRRELHSAGRLVHLTPKAFDLLRVLVENRSRAVSKAELFALVWPGVFVSEDSLAHLVAEIRSAIGDSARSPRWLRTVHGYGYTLAAPAEAEPAPVAAGPQFVLQCGSRQFPLDVGKHLIGRDASAGILIHSPAVSRRHASVSVTGAAASIEDLGSKNGTFVGSLRLSSPYELHEGDRIRIGDFTLVFSCLSGAMTETFSL